MKHLITIIVAAVATLSLAAAKAEEMQTNQHEQGGTAAGYAPGLGEIMSFQQMRHSKLWFAGQARNWGLAAYEVDELKEGFEDVSKYSPTHDGVTLTPMVDAITQKEIADLDKAVESKDRAAFVTSFDRLTAACNACHQSAKHAFIVIQRPTGLPYTNQNFTPARQSGSAAQHRH